MSHDQLGYLKHPPQRYIFDGCKLMWHQERVQDFLDGKHVMPIHIDMGIHKACNISCRYCYGVKQGKSGEYIESERLQMLAKDAGKVGVKSIAIIGDGEPTMNRGLYDFVDTGVGEGVDMSLGTNGLLLDTSKINRLTSKLTWIRFNVSGGPNKYAYVMGARPGDWEVFDLVVQEAVLKGKKYGCTVGLQMVLIPDCFDQVLPLAEYAMRVGVDYLVIKQFSDGGQGMPLHFDMEEYKRVERELKQAEGMSNENTKIIVKWSAIGDTMDITGRRIFPFDSCIDLPFIFQISGDGGCYPCGYLFGAPEFCYGNVRQDGLERILHSQRYKDIIKRVRECELNELCQGQCRHCETNKFMDRVTKEYRVNGGKLENAIIKLCGSKEQYDKLLANPPKHINFI